MGFLPLPNNQLVQVLVDDPSFHAQGSAGRHGIGCPHEDIYGSITPQQLVVGVLVRRWWYTRANATVGVATDPWVTNPRAGTAGVTTDRVTANRVAADRIAADRVASDRIS